MPDVSVGSQIFDLVFHPSHSTVYTALLSGKVKAVSYDKEGNHKQQFSIKLSQKSCRSITINSDGTRLYAAGKGKGIHTLDTETGKVTESRVKAHETSINRVKHVQPWLFATGDDDGVIKLWDSRKKECLRTYKHHFDYITDFLWLNDTKHLVATSEAVHPSSTGDGTLSVLDIRSKKAEPFAHSEDQEDELLSIVSIKGGAKVIVGTQIGVLSVFNRSSGWGDCVDRIPGHPHSVDALCALPLSLPNVDSSSTILTGSSDGFLRAVHIFPTKLGGVVADHGDWPVERIAIGEGMNQLSLDDDNTGEESRDGSVHKAKSSDEDDGDEPEAKTSSGVWWAGSVGHDETLKLTDIGLFFNQENGLSDDDNQDADSFNDSEEDATASATPGDFGRHQDIEKQAKDSDDEAVEDDSGRKKRKRKNKDPMAVKKKGKNEVEVQGSFFDEL
ncbi:protein monoubiquitination-related protein [Moniliophthora roreri MCA 2997]|uniref:WD repeat-containing protein JIP5 n=1 Tax=Moniliophthora roreri (strain MCA 2997) TaxID=1381753 RepID=V2YJ01_MONRO|nr:protein monoubiquitination-related protein [Moniliophthora roreri MCA 2997]